MTLVTCPLCGARFRSGQLACKECGSDAETGWKSGEDIDYAAVDIPDEDTDETLVESLAALHPTRPDLWSSRQFRRFVIGVTLVIVMVLPGIVLLWRHFAR